MLGAPGLALGNSLALGLASIFLYRGTRRSAARMPASTAAGSPQPGPPASADAPVAGAAGGYGYDAPRELVRAGAALVLMAAGVALVALVTAPLAARPGLAWELLAAAVPAGAGVAVYAAALLLLGAREATALWSRAMKRTGARPPL